MMTRILNTYPDAEVITVLTNSTLKEMMLEDPWTTKVGEINAGVKEICRYLDIPCIDIFGGAIEWEKSDFSSPTDPHPNPTAMCKIAHRIESELAEMLDGEIPGEAVLLPEIHHGMEAAGMDR